MKRDVSPSVTALQPPTVSNPVPSEVNQAGPNKRAKMENEDLNSSVKPSETQEYRKGEAPVKAE
jgi:hypothetical protein